MYNKFFFNKNTGSSQKLSFWKTFHLFFKKWHTSTYSNSLYFILTSLFIFANFVFFLHFRYFSNLTFDFLKIYFGTFAPNGYCFVWVRVGVRNYWYILWLKLHSPWDGNRPSSIKNQPVQWENLQFLLILFL